MPLRNVMFLFMTAIVSFGCYLKAERNRYAAQVAEAMKVVSDLYVEPVEQRQLFEHAMEGMLEGLDPYSAYVGPEVFQAMEQSLDQEFGGVGIEVEKKTDEDPILVLTPLFDSPAYHAGMRSGDQILAIDGESTMGMKPKDAISRMRGKPGSLVKLLIRHADSPEELPVEVTRAIIVVDSLLGDTRRPDGTWDYHLRGNPRIGYLRLVTFGKHSAMELRQVLGDGRGCPFDAVILDLRDNAGGLLDTAVETCDMFLDSGRIVSTRGRDGVDRRVYEATPSTVISDSIPLVVLINKYSASASEIVAGCLQDHGRAIVIGERSWGKGTVQNLFELEGGRSALKLTTATYWRPSNKNIHRRENAPENEDWGVRPNEGYEMVLTDDQWKELYAARRERDTGRRSPQASTEAAQPVDPHVQRAREYLEAKL